MSERSRWVTGFVLASAVLAGLMVMKLRAPGDADEGAAATDVAVHAGTITRATLHRYVTAYGRVQPEPPGTGQPPAGMTLGAPVAGILVGIDCTEGQRVAKGQALFRLDSRVAEVALDKARRALEFAERTYERQRQLLAADATSERAALEAGQQRDAARADVATAEAELGLRHITAPLAGTVVRIDAKLGQSVDSGSVLAEIVDLERLVVAARVPSREAALLRVGQRVELRPDGSAAGRLTFVGDDVDPATDTLPVRASLPAGAGFQPGEFLEVRVVAEEHRACLAVPEVSVVTKAGEGAFVVLVAGDRAVRRPVKAGLRERGLVEVEGDGLEPGMAIVTDDAYSLPPDTRVRVTGR